MPDHASPPSKVPLIAASICLIIGVVLPLLVWTYAKTEPTLWGIPFFFWYQFLLVIVTVVLTSCAYQFVTSYEKERRAREKSNGGTSAEDER